MAPSKGRAQLLQDLDEHITKDYDPEGDIQDNEEGSGSEESDDGGTGTEHYVQVGKSKLREKDGVSLGPQYRGARVSRDALQLNSDDESEGDDDDGADGEDDDDEDDYDDPDTANLEADAAEASDAEIESDDALAESDAERFTSFVFRGSAHPTRTVAKRGSRAAAADFMPSSGDEEDEEEQGGAGVDEHEDEDSDDELMDDGLDALVNGSADSEESESGEDAAELDQDDEISESESADDDGPSANGTAVAAIASSSMGRSRPDVTKGIAIQQQRKMYEGLLNLRIRLQKALVASNTIPTVDSDLETESQPYEAAEEAAVKLLNTINTMRADFGPPSRSAKRKRDMDLSLSSQGIWEQMQDEESRLAKFRAATLEKWSRKVQAVNAVSTNRLGPGARPLTDALQEQLANPESRLVKRTRIPRSCAPVQAAKRVTEDKDIYDDADFYQQLLKELVDQRTVDSSTAQAGALPTVMLAATKEAKVRNVVDRKASKGRKMRFTVHEKLQNFMAPEDRGTWEPEAIERFFGTLFGQKMELNEDEVEDEDMDGVDANDEGIQLFRT